MSQAPLHTRPNPSGSPLASACLTFLAWAARPPWAKDPPAAPPPLWVSPGDTGKTGSLPFPHAEAIRGVLLEYAATLGIPMTFRIATSRYSRPAFPDAVHVHAFALPTPPLLFGVWPRVPLVALPFAHGVPLGDSAHLALAEGTQFGRGRLLLDGDGRAVGEYLGANLYCLFDLLAQEAAWVPLLLRRHLDLGLPQLLTALAVEGAGPAGWWAERLSHLRQETDALVQARGAALRGEAREAYVRACQERVAEEIRFLQTEIAFLEDGVEETARRIAADTRRLTEGRRRLRLLQGGPDLSESGERDLEGLRGLPEVREARVLDGRISVTTAPILVEHERRRYRLGSFRLDLYFNGDVRVANLTDRVGAYDHPHIHRGRPCLGDAREGVAKLLGEFQLVAATAVLLDFLMTVNPAEWRLPVGHWPEAGEDASRGVPAAA